jgi:hypothetical protein
MARTASVKKLALVRKPKIHTTKTEQYLINIKYMGEEPSFDGKPVQDLEYSKAHTWYSYMSEKNEAKEYLESYLKNANRLTDIENLNKVPEAYFPYYAAYIARMISRGANLPENRIETINKLLLSSFEKINKNKYDGLTQNSSEVARVKPKVKISIQERVSDKVGDFINEFEEAFDDKGHTLSMYAWLQQKEIPPLLAGKIADFYRPISQEANQVIRKNADEQLLEGYNHLSLEQKKARAAFYNSILSDCERYASNTKVVKVTRKPRPVTIEKKLKFVKYQKENNEFKIVSIKPEKIIGAQEFWMFNTKYKTLTVFVALDRGGLDMVRTSIIKYDPLKTFTYRLGKKASSVINSVLIDGKIAVRKIMASLKKNEAIQERINENTILMKVV